MNADFVASLHELASSRRARIGIGISPGESSTVAGLVRSLEAASEYAELVAVTGCGQCPKMPPLEVIESEDPATELVDLLARGEIDGAVRGNVSASRAMKTIARRFSIKVRRMVLMNLNGWSFFLGPVGIDEGDTVGDRLDLTLRGGAYLRRLGVDPSLAVLSGGRMEDLGRSYRIDRSLAEGELIASQAREAGLRAVHRTILIEDCRGDDLIVAPDGISGNLVFRTLMLLCGAEALGAPVLMERVFVDSSRARKDFLGPVTLASALVAMEEDE